MSEHLIHLATQDGQKLSFSCNENEDLLSAAARQNIYLAAQCRVGTCGMCTARCVRGDYTLGEHSPDALGEAAAAQQQILLCRTYPRSSLSLALPYTYDLIRLEKIPVRTAEIVAKTYLTPDTVKLELQLLADDDGNLSLDFEPGQFVELTVPGTIVKRAYSMANAPNWEGALEFVIKLRPNGTFSSFLHKDASPGMLLTLEGPQGKFKLEDRGLNPRYFIAGGCGLAAVMSMLRRMAEWQDPQQACLFFGVWREDEVFYQQELRDLATAFSRLHYQICVTQASEQWSGCHGSVVDAFKVALEQAESRPDVYVCGSSGLVDSVAEAAVEQGIAREQLIYERYSSTCSIPG